VHVELGVTGIDVVVSGPWIRPRISEKRLAKIARSLPGVLGWVAVPIRKDGPRLVGSKDNVFGG